LRKLPVGLCGRGLDPGGCRGWRRLAAGGEQGREQRSRNPRAAHLSGSSDSRSTILSPTPVCLPRRQDADDFSAAFGSRRRSRTRDHQSEIDLIAHRKLGRALGPEKHAGGRYVVGDAPAILEIQRDRCWSPRLFSFVLMKHRLPAKSMSSCPHRRIALSARPVNGYRVVVCRCARDISTSILGRQVTTDKKMALHQAGASRTHRPEAVTRSPRGVTSSGSRSRAGP